MKKSKDVLKKSLGLFSLVFYGVGMILGAGIYSIIGKAAGLAGESLWLSFLLAAVSAALSALSYAELASMFPRAGGEYVYLSYSFPTKKWIAVASGLMMSFSAAATAAAVALAFAGYLSHFFELPLIAVAVFVLAFFAGLNAYGIRESSRLNVLFTLIEAFGLCLIIWLGFTQGDPGKILSKPVGMGVFPAASLVLFAFLGFENLVNFTEEARDATHNIPRAILISLSVSAVLYILVSVSAVSVLEPGILAVSTAPLMDVALIKSKSFGETLGAVALFSTANTVLIAQLAGSRILYGMANGNHLPGFIAKIHPKKQTPWVAAILIFAVSLLLIPLGSVEVVASLSSLATILSFVLVNFSVIILRFRMPAASRPFKIPVSVGRLPLLPVFGIFAAGFLIFEFQKMTYMLLAVYWIGAVLIYSVFVLSRRKGTFSRKKKINAHILVQPGADGPEAYRMFSDHKDDCIKVVMKL